MAGRPKGLPRTGGRKPGTPNRATRELRDLAQQYVPASLKELARLAIKAESEQARVAAIKEIFDRAYGRPAQAIAHSGAVGSYDLSKVSDQDLKRIEAVLSTAAADGDPGGVGQKGS